MNKKRILNVIILVGFVLAYTFSLVSPSAAQNKPFSLKGEYGLVGQSTCLTHWTVNPNGGNTSTHFVHTASAQGTMTFNGHGTGWGTIYSVDVTLPIYSPIPNSSFWPDPTTPGILGYSSTNVVDFEFTYTITPDGKISRTLTRFEGTITSGPSQGKTFTQTLFTLSGFVSKDMRTILLSSVPGQEEELTTEIFNSDNTLYGIQKRECHRTRTLTLIDK